MSKTWIVSDYHLGETRLELLGRPFRSATEMFNELLWRHNVRVAPTDRVYVLGDVCYKLAPEALKDAARFHGRKILVRGNHDRNITDDEFLRAGFEQVVPEGDGIEVELAGIPCYLTHYPTCGRPDRFNLVGHIHAAWRVQQNMLNVGVDVHHFLPTPEERVKFFYDAIAQVYDKDVWVADHPANAAHTGRGKPGSYLDARTAH